MAKRNKRPLAVFKYAQFLKLGDFIIRVRGIVTKFTDNALVLGTPSPTTTVVSGHIDDLQTAEDAVQSKTTGTFTTRDLKYDIVLEDVFQWQRYIQSLVDAENDPATKLNLISLSGFDVKAVRVYDKPKLSAKETITPGTVKLMAKAALLRPASYEWQMSSNNGVTWTNLPNSLVAHLFVSGLTSKATYKFRVRTTTKAGTSGWIATVEIVIQ